ncbi:MAG: sigma-70 family RNA polymerase sigma factor [Myxococcota bacterium]
MAPESDDRGLYEAWATGDKAAGAELFDRYFAPMSRFFANKVGEAADDLIQQTFLGCVEAKERFANAASFRTFLFAIAHNVLRNHYRAKRGAREDPDFSITAVAQLAPSAGSLLVAKGERRALLEGLRSIPLASQLILELVYWERMKAREVAAVVDAPEGTVRTRLRKAKHELATALQKLQRRTEPLESTVMRLSDWAEAVRTELPGGSAP